MSGRGEKRLTIAVLDADARLIGIEKRVPRPVDVTLPDDCDLPLDGSYWWDAERRCFQPWRGAPMTLALILPASSVIRR